MRIQEIFVLADQTLNNVVAQIRDDQWDMDMPPDFATTSQGKITLREVVNYHAYDDAWVPDMLAGKTMDEAGKTNYEGDLLSDDPKGNFARIVADACAAVQVHDDLERTVHCSFGDYSAHDYLKQTIFFRGLRAHDIADVIGVDSTLPPELVQGLWTELSPVAEEWRAIGVYGPKIEVPEDAPLQSKLLGLTGRKP